MALRFKRVLLNPDNNEPTHNDENEVSTNGT